MSGTVQGSVALPRIIVVDQDTAEAVWCNPAKYIDIDHIVSIRVPGEPMPRGLRGHPARKLVLEFDDVSGPLREDPKFRPIQPVSRAQIRRILRFARGIDGVTLVHCAAGTSRSPAVALAMIAALHGPGRELESVAELRRIRPYAGPCARVVFLADEALGRESRLYDAFRDEFWAGTNMDWSHPRDWLGADTVDDCNPPPRYDDP